MVLSLALTTSSQALRHSQLTLRLSVRSTPRAVAPDLFALVVVEEALEVEHIERLHRGLELAARVGGEEFALLLPDTTVQEAALEADRIRVAFSQSVHPTLDGSVRLSASFGVAGFERGTPVREALRQADLALYAAKRSGRNLVRIAQDEAALSAPLANAA